MAEFPIVGIGSSAGGLEPLQKLFSAMPDKPGLAFIVAAHLDPTQKSHLAELLSRCTAMTVVQIEAAVMVEPDHVYVIAPDQELTIEEGVVTPNKPTLPRGHRHPVDSFLRSLAEDQGERAVAIILSGTGSNGSMGLRFIKAEGGIVIVQKPETAAFQGMPRSAVGTGVADLVLSPEEMPEALLGLAHHSYVRQPAQVAAEARPEEQFRALLSLVRIQTKRDFGSYKKATLLRRVHRRMGLHRIDSLPHYLDRLRNDPDEVKALAADLTINVTGFFRDPKAWDVLTERVIAPLVRERATDRAIRVWVPACSTGEEAYSIGMLLIEQAEAAGKSFDVKLFATDVADSVLPLARAGQYPGSIALDVGEERLERFFELQDDVYRVRKVLRELITFAPQSLMQDPPFSHLDLISCRNLLIYIEPAAQRQVLGVFHFALQPDGHLFLGPAENTTGLDELFQPVSKKWRIYRRVGPTRHDLMEFPSFVGRDPANLGVAEPAVPEPRVPARELLDQALVERYALASVLIDEHHRVHYFRGPVEYYLGPPSGEPTHNLLAIARPGLQGPLRAAITRSLSEGEEVLTNARVQINGAARPVQMVVTPVRTGRGAPRLMVSFSERATAADGDASSASEGADERQLQDELGTAREDLRLTIEQLEVSNEELKASNEEIRSINEELQASNEELETSKEELQSLNEELNTVNNQLQAKVEELEGRTDDLNNLLNSTDIATLFLDRQLCIRWFTPAMKELLALMPGDLGRPIAHFAQRFTGADLVADARGVLATLSPSDTEVVSHEGRWYIRRSQPYRSAADRIGGVVMSFTDITSRKQAEQQISAAREFAESIVDTVREPLIVLTPELRVRSANESFYRTFQVTREDTEGRPIYDLGNRQWDIPELRRLLEEVLPEAKQLGDFVVEHEFETIGRRIMLLNARQMESASLILLAIEDVTERKQAEAALQTSEERLRRVLETEAVGVLFLDRSGTVIDTNGAFLRMTGYSREEVSSRALTWRTMTPPEWVEVSEAQMEGLARTGRIGPYEKEYLHKDGSRSWMLLAGQRLDEGSSVKYCIDISDRKRAEDERELLTRELSHRVKNMFAVVQALATQTDGRLRSVDAFREAFLGRLHALAAAHGLLEDTPVQGADLKALVERVLAAFHTGDRGVVEVDGERVKLTAQQSLGLGLVLHELGTNAAKHGALSHPDGRLRVSWRTEGADLRLRWEERGGPPVTPPSATGFGSRLIETICRHQLAGAVERDYAPAGLVCEITFPVT